MPKTKAPKEFPEPGQGASMASYSFDKLIPMRDGDASAGWRILYDEDDPGNASIVYVACHPRGGYDRTIYYSHGSKRLDQDTYRQHFAGRLQEIDAPVCWDDMIGRIGIEDAVEHINALRKNRALRGEVVR